MKADIAKELAALRRDLDKKRIADKKSNREYIRKLIKTELDKRASR